VNEHGKTDLHAPQETVPTQSPASRPRECSDKHPQPTPELINRALEAAPPEMTLNSKWDTAGDVSSCINSSGVPRHVPYPFVVPVLPSPEPTASLWAHPVNPIHPPDTPHEENVINALGRPNSPQVGLKTAAKQSPEPRLIDRVAALV
jgi:hypothetical protein